MTQRMKVMVLILTAAVVALLFLPCALADGFQKDLDAIDQAAKSVLKLTAFDSSGKVIGTGSGFVAYDESTLVTNAHVIEGADWLLAASDAGHQYILNKVIAADEKRDIALLCFMSPTDLKPLELYMGFDLMRAAPVVAIGSPKGVKNTVSLGNIGAVYMYKDVSTIQFTAPISQGSSGGALFNDQGQVIGITSAYLADSQNMNLAVDIWEVIYLKEASTGMLPVSFMEHWKRSKLPATATPIVYVTPAPTPTPTNMPNRTPDSIPAPTPVTQIDLVSMWTYAGVVLRWQPVPGAKQYLVYTFGESGKYELLSTLGAGETYYLDTEGDFEKLMAFYKIEAVLDDEGTQIIKSKATTSYSEYKGSNLSIKLRLVTAEMGTYGPVISWTKVDEAIGYVVFREPASGGSSKMLGYTKETVYTDYDAAPGGAYVYTVRSVAVNEVSGKASSGIVHVPLEMPVLTPQTKASSQVLLIGDWGYTGEYYLYPWLMPSVINSSTDRIVTGFELVYYCEDKDRNAIYHKDTGSVYYIHQYDMTIGPSMSMYPPQTWLYGFADAMYINVAVAGIMFSDGTSVQIPQREFDFFYWDLK